MVHINFEYIISNAYKKKKNSVINKYTLIARLLLIVRMLQNVRIQFLVHVAHP